MGSSLREYLPSTAFVGVAIPLVIGFGVAGALLYLSFGNTQKEVAAESDLSVVATQALLDYHFADKDSDGDGLQDWEEGLWKTDPQNPDTDGDGTYDNEEILAQRDPLVAGPGDTIASTTAAAQLAAGTSSDLTRDLSRNFFGSYLELKTTGQYNEFNKERLLRTTIAQTTRNSQLVLFTRDEVTVVPNTSDTRIAYAQLLVAQIETLSPLEDEVALTYQALLNTPDGTPETTANIEVTLAENARLYALSRDTLLSAPVPEGLEDAHLAFINVLHRQHHLVRSLRGLFDDPLRALTMLGQWEAIRQDARTSLVDIANTLEELGLTREEVQGLSPTL